MKEAILLVTLTFAGCASAPRPKAPDESHRIPVNRVVPPEATPEGGPESQKPGKARRDAREVEWR